MRRKIFASLHSSASESLRVFGIKFDWRQADVVEWGEAMKWGISAIIWKKLQFHNSRGGKKFFIKLLKNTFSDSLILCFFGCVEIFTLRQKFPAASFVFHHTYFHSYDPSIASSTHYTSYRTAQSLSGSHLLCLFKNSEKNSIHFQCRPRFHLAFFDI